MHIQKEAYSIYNAAITAVQPFSLIKKHLFISESRLHIGEYEIEINSINNFILIAAGKAASAMAKEVELQLGDLITGGICITKYNHASELKKIKTIEAAHPAPDENSILAGKETLGLVEKLSNKDIVLLLLSGGASSLLADLPDGCTLEETKQLFNLLVNSGASIHEINIVRKHVSGIKGGQLVRSTYPAKIFTLIISDVAGDDQSSIASGPTVPDPSTFKDAYYILIHYGIWPQISTSVKRIIYNGMSNPEKETPGPGDIIFNNAYSKIIGNNLLALVAAKEKAEELGFHTSIINNNLHGNTEEEARNLVQYLLNYKGNLPACIIMGGETTLKVSGNGKGGRNQHFALCALDEFRKHFNENNFQITILCAGTDGTDGPTDAAGAIINNEMQFDEIDFLKSLLNFDAYHFFEKSGGLIKTGPTQTNVMDIAIALIHNKTNN